jgi:hypothetical protein
MSPEVIIAIIGFVIVALTGLVVVLKFTFRRAPLRPRKKSYTKRWKDLQKYCKTKETWPEALFRADSLLDRALIKRGFKGKTMGERLVNAQRKFTDNDELWYAHKLCKKLRDNPELKLKEREVKDALIGSRQALKDLGAL